MADIDEALRELRSTLLSIKFFDVALASLIVLAAGLIATTFFSLPWTLALIPWFIFAAVMGWRRVNIQSYHEVEEKVPQLREALQTAADNAGREGRLVSELHQDVVRKMSHIKTSYFLGLGSTTRQLLLLTGISFIVIGLAAFNVTFDSTSDFLGKNAFIHGAFDAFGFGNLSNESAVNARLAGKKIPGKLKYVRLRDNGSLYGELTDVDLGTVPLELQVDPVNSGANLKEEHEAEDKRFGEQEAGEIGANAQEACGTECSIPADQQDIVKSYFEKVSTP